MKRGKEEGFIDTLFICQLQIIFVWWYIYIEYIHIYPILKNWVVYNI